jgi:hypothetical protein
LLADPVLVVQRLREVNVLRASSLVGVGAYHTRSLLSFSLSQVRSPLFGLSRAIRRHRGAVMVLFAVLALGALTDRSCGQSVAEDSANAGRRNGQDTSRSRTTSNVIARIFDCSDARRN